MFIELYKFSKLVIHLNSCFMDLGRDNFSLGMHLESFILRAFHAFRPRFWFFCEIFGVFENF